MEKAIPQNGSSSPAISAPIDEMREVLGYFMEVLAEPYWRLPERKRVGHIFELLVLVEFWLDDRPGSLRPSRSNKEEE